MLTNLWNRGSEASEGHYVKTSGLPHQHDDHQDLRRRSELQRHLDGPGRRAASRPAKRRCRRWSWRWIPISTGVDNNVGYTRVYGSHISWAGPTRPLPREINPRLVYERLFRASQPRAAAAAQDKLLLDRVLDDAERAARPAGRGRSAAAGRIPAGRALARGAAGSHRRADAQPTGSRERRSKRPSCPRRTRRATRTTCAGCST